MPIDLVEAAMAVIGVQPIVSRNVERFTKGKWNEADALGRRIQSAARDVCDGTMSTKIPLGSVNYNVILKDLTEPFNEAQLVEMVAQFPPELHELSSAFIMKAQEVVGSLRQILPIAEHKTIAGSHVVPPSQMQLRRFVSTLTVLDDPMRMFPLMAAGALLNTQTISVRKIYPSISRAIDEALQEAIEASKARKKSYELPPRAEIGVGAWRGNPQVDKKLHTVLQGGLEQAAQDRQNAKPQPSSAQTSVAAKEALSPGQRANYPHAAPGTAG
jgi:hypothetical protein